MAPIGLSYRPDDLRDAIVACHLNKISLRDVPAKYDIPSLLLREMLDDLAAILAVRIASGQEPLRETKDQKQVSRWATKYTKASCKNGDGYTDWEVRSAL